MAESLVNTFKRDHVARMDLCDAQTVLAQLPAAFEHFNEVHPHSSQKMRSPGSSAIRGQPSALLQIGRGREYGGNIMRKSQSA